MGCSWGDSGGQKGDQGGPKTGHRAIWGSKGPLEGSLGHFGGAFGVEKRVLLRCHNLKIRLAGPMKSQYFGFWTLVTKMEDFGSILGGMGGRCYVGLSRGCGCKPSPQDRDYSNRPLCGLPHRWVDISVFRYICPSVHRCVDISMI